MVYSKYDKNRVSKKHSTAVYDLEALKGIAINIKEYYEIASPEVLLNTNEAYFIPLANAINDSRFGGKEIIKAKYLCEIFNGTTTSKRKSKVKMKSISEFLSDWLSFHRKSIKEALTENDNGALNDWHALTNTSTVQWTDYRLLPTKNGMIERFTWNIFTKSKYYRFGFKFLQVNGKLFGDGSIQSQDNNFIIHIGKNFISKELFITSYRNGIREYPDRFTNIVPKNNTYTCEFNIEPEGLLHFFINNKEVYRGLVNREIRSRVYMLIWGDGNKYEVNVKNIRIEIGRA